MGAVEDEQRRATAAIDQIVELAIELGGTCTAEHGVGLNKKKFLRKELGDAAVDFQTQLKMFIDPLCIFNPHKIVDAYEPLGRL